MSITAISLSAWRVGILASLFPTLLLLPSFHLHLALEHRQGAHGPHAHPAVVHADFFPSSASEHLDHHEEKSGSEDVPLTLRPQIGLLTLLSRLVALPIPLFERSLDVLAAQEVLASLLFSSPLWGGTHEQRPPIQTCVLSQISPRSPPALT
jgi:hypothetical protein